MHSNKPTTTIIGQFFKGAEPSLPEKYFDSAPYQPAKLFCPTHPHPIIVRKKFRILGTSRKHKLTLIELYIMRAAIVIGI